MLKYKSIAFFVYIVSVFAGCTISIQRTTEDDLVQIRYRIDSKHSGSQMHEIYRLDSILRLLDTMLLHCGTSVEDKERIIRTVEQKYRNGDIFCKGTLQDGLYFPREYFKRTDTADKINSIESLILLARKDFSDCVADGYGWEYDASIKSFSHKGVVNTLSESIQDISCNKYSGRVCLSDDPVDGRPNVLDRNGRKVEVDGLTPKKLYSCTAYYKLTVEVVYCSGKTAKKSSEYNDGYAGGYLLKMVHKAGQQFE